MYNYFNLEKFMKEIKPCCAHCKYCVCAGDNVYCNRWGDLSDIIKERVYITICIEFLYDQTILDDYAVDNNILRYMRR